MKINALRFLTDENIDQELVEFLRANNFEVFDIKENGLFRLADDAILKMGFEHQFVVISQDSDFGTLIFRDKNPFHGLVYLRPGHQSANLHIETLRAVIAAPLDFEIPFILVAENTGELVRIRLRSI